MGTSPCIVLNVVGLIKDQDGVADVDIHGLADDRVYEVVVRTEHQLSLPCMSWSRSALLARRESLCRECTDKHSNAGRFFARIGPVLHGQRSFLFSMLRLL